MPSSAFKMAMPKFCGRIEMCCTGWSHTLKLDVNGKAAPVLCLWIAFIHLTQMCSQSACSWLSTGDRELPRAWRFREAGWWARWHPWEWQSVGEVCGARKRECAHVCRQGGFLEKESGVYAKSNWLQQLRFLIRRWWWSDLHVESLFCRQCGEWLVGVESGSQGGGCCPPLLRGLSQTFLKCVPLSGPRGWREVDGLRHSERTTLTGLRGSQVLGRGRSQSHSCLQVSGSEKLGQMVAAHPGNSCERGK